MGEIVKRPVVRSSADERRDRDPADDAPRALLRSPRRRRRAGERLPAPRARAARSRRSSTSRRWPRRSNLDWLGTRAVRRGARAPGRGGRGAARGRVRRPAAAARAPAGRHARPQRAAREPADAARASSRAAASRCTRSRAAATSPGTGPASSSGYLIVDLAARGMRGRARLPARHRGGADRGARRARRRGAARAPGMTGVFVAPARRPPRKLASIGVGLRGWVTLARLRAERDARIPPGFGDIVPCGLARRGDDLGGARARARAARSASAAERAFFANARSASPRAFEERLA